MIQQIKKFVQSSEVKKILISLKNAELERVSITEKMQPKYDAILKNRNIELKYSDLYFLDSKICDSIFAEKKEIDRANGFDVSKSFCPILVSESKVRNIYHLIIEKISKDVDSTFQNVTLNLNHYRKFKEIILSIAMMTK